MKFAFDSSQLDALKAKYEDYAFGNVEVCINEYFVDEYNEWVDSIGAKSSSSTVTLLYGRGSVGPHTDECDGYVLLTLLSCFTPDGHEVPDFEAHDGEFYCKNNFHKMQPGDSIIFDDMKTHAWICNSHWIFASIPLEEDYVKSLPRKFVGEILKDRLPTVH